MNIIRTGTAVAATMALVACNATGDGGSGTGTPAPSTIFDLNLPDDFDQSALPGSAQTALAEFNRRNEGTVATGGPTGNSHGNFVFFGNDTLGIAVEDGAGGYSLVQGDVQLNGSVDTARIGGFFQDLSITDANGDTTQLLGQVVRLEGGSIVNGRFSNTLSTDGTFKINGAPANVTGTSQGAFVGDGSEALGIVGGSITVGTDPAQGFAGGYTADQISP